MAGGYNYVDCTINKKDENGNVIDSVSESQGSHNFDDEEGESEFTPEMKELVNTIWHGYLERFTL